MKGKRRKGTVVYEERGLVKDKRHYLSGKILRIREKYRNGRQRAWISTAGKESER